MGAVPSQRQLVHAWWRQLDQPARRRLLALSEGDFLPGDLALNAQLAEVSVIAVGTVLVEDGYQALYEQPDALRALLEEEQRAG